ncbi:unnamed protein product [Acanthoscelides obtectus]|uniref:Uncharacterized protein n=1 Tax=Acanthoscelides obtectus TaxID=200917 RepID=A0A9P0K836_ACAOB|nr:unnamed protein product [Acanthoscelides obtectus]CAK1657049.1 hypothetical protein AOBTE_LOCUS20086 [Acanthoscelides obtectus]
MLKQTIFLLLLMLVVAWASPQRMGIPGMGNMGGGRSMPGMGRGNMGMGNVMPGRGMGSMGRVNMMG